MSFALTPASPYVDGVGVVPASWLNFVRIAFPDAVDGVGGGPFNLQPGATLSFPGGGGDINFGAHFTATDADITIPSGNTLLVLGTETLGTGGQYHALSGATLWRVDCTALFNGGVDFAGPVQADDVVSLQGVRNFLAAPTYVNNGKTLHIGDNTFGVGHLVIDATGGGAGSDMTVQGAAQVTITGSGTIVTFASSSALTLNSGTAFTANGQSSLANIISATQTGAYVKSGNGAVTRLRTSTLPDADATFTASQADIWEIGPLTAARTYLIAAESTTFTFIVRQISAATQAFDATIANASAPSQDIATFLSASPSAEHFGTVMLMMRGSVNKAHTLFVEDGTTGALTTPVPLVTTP